MFARLSGGGEKKIDPGFEVMKKLKKSVISSSPGWQDVELFQSKEAWIGLLGSGRVYSSRRHGFPIEFVYPKKELSPGSHSKYGEEL